jgi:predicted nucleotidyltransferase
VSAADVLRRLTDGALTSGLPKYVSGVALAGSHARGEDTPHSDVDLFVVLDNCEPAVYHGRIDEVVDAMPSTSIRRGPVPIPHFGDTVTLLYADSSVVQINFNTWESLEANPMRRSSKVILDRDGVYAQFLLRCSDIRLPQDELYREYADWFIIRAVFACRALMKGELLRSCGYLNDMREALMQLVRLTAGMFDEVRNPYLPSRRFERDVGAEKATQVGNLMPSYSEASVLRAIAVSLEVFASLQEEAVGFGYDPKPAIEQISAMSLWLQ